MRRRPCRGSWPPCCSSAAFICSAGPGRSSPTRGSTPTPRCSKHAGAPHERRRHRAHGPAQEFRADRDHPRRQPDHPARRAPRHDRSQRRRQIDAVQPDQRTPRPTAGGIRCKGEDITGQKPYQINRRGLSRSFQVTNIFPRLSVWENIRCAVLWSLGYRYSFWHGINSLADVRQRTEQILEEIHLADRRRIQAGVLTYAEQRALEIGITIAGGAEIILLDEPTAGMSHAETEDAVALIRKVSAGRTLMMIEHDMGVVFDLADRISVLVYGQIIACDAPAKIKADAAVQQAYLGTAVGAAA